MKEKKFSFEETVSQRHKNSVLNAVEAELKLNRKSQTSGYSKSWLSLPLALAFSAVVYFQFVDPINKATDFETAMSANLIMELAALSPAEVEIVEDLELMEALDRLSPEELEEVLL